MAERVTVTDDEAKEQKTYTGVAAKILTILSIVYVLLEVAALQFIVIDLWVFMAIVLIFVFILGYMTIPFKPGASKKVGIIDWAFMAAGVLPCVYLIIEMDRLQWTYGSTVTPADVVFGMLLTLSLLELVRRSFGKAMPLTVLFFLAYAFFGRYLPPDYFGHTGIRVENVFGFMLGLPLHGSGPVTVETGGGG